MKIRNKRLLRAAGWAGSRLIRGLVRTLRFEYHWSGPPLAPEQLGPGPRYIYISWHENLILPAVWFGRPDVAALISKHADGQLLGSLLEAIGMGMIHGSTSRGGIEAVRQLVSGGRDVRRHLAVTPDGPRGPRRVVQPGIIYIASRAGMDIVPVGVGYQRPWRAGSWDRFALPKPFSRARIVTAEPIAIPDGLRMEELDHWRGVVQAELERLSGIAERWAETGQLELQADDLRTNRAA